MIENSEKIKTDVDGNVSQPEQDFHHFRNLAYSQLSKGKSMEYCMQYLAHTAKADFDPERTLKLACWTFVREKHVGGTAADDEKLIGDVFKAYSLHWDGEKGMQGLTKITNDKVQATVLYFAMFHYSKNEPGFQRRYFGMYVKAVLLMCLICTVIVVVGGVTTLFFGKAGGVVVITVVLMVAGSWALLVNLLRLFKPAAALRKFAL